MTNDDQGERMINDLLPCPFCGGAVRFVDLNSGPGMRPATTRMAIQCARCENAVDFGQRSMLKMKQLWNTRPPPLLRGYRPNGFNASRD